MVKPSCREDVKHGPASQGKEDQEFQQGKAATGLLAAGLGVTPLVGMGIGQLRGGAVHDFDRPALQGSAGLRSSFGSLSGGHPGFFQPFLGQALASLDIGRVAFIDWGAAAQAQERLDLAHHLATGGPGPEHLPDEAFQGQAQAKDALPAVGAVLLGAEERRRQKIAQLLLKLGQSGLSDGVGGAPAQNGQPGTEGGEMRCWHSKYIYSLH
jgi:hypothetical protein